MQAIDTNVVVRYLTADDEEQYRLAVAVVEGGPTFLPITVLLEADWVLRSVYGVSAKDAVRQLCAFARLPEVRLESGPRAMQAFAWAEEGVQFADALHLAGSTDCERFATFDRDLAKAARQRGFEVNESKA